jgi:Uma2 family endonuclease
MYTIYNEDEKSYQKVEEPDPSLTYTYADYMKWKFLERLELLKGKIFQLSAANTIHQRVSMKLGFDLYGFLKGKTCQVFIAPFDVRLPVKNRKKDDQITTVVQPDVCVFCDPVKIDERGACGAPDLVVEILSPSNSQYDVRDKFDVYQEAGVKEYWIVSPMQESVMVSLLQEEGRFGPSTVYKGDDTLHAATVPGFSVKISELFTH